MSYESEAIDRNAVLSEKHGKLPSYSMWRATDIQQSSFQSRYDWWKNINIEQSSLLAYTVSYWKNYLSKKNSQGSVNPPGKTRKLSQKSQKFFTEKTSGAREMVKIDNQ